MFLRVLKCLKVISSLFRIFAGGGGGGGGGVDLFLPLYAIDRTCYF